MKKILLILSCSLLFFASCKSLSIDEEKFEEHDVYIPWWAK